VETGDPCLVGSTFPLNAHLMARHLVRIKPSLYNVCACQDQARRHEEPRPWDLGQHAHDASSNNVLNAHGLPLQADL
jgi:hypothetical protein